MKFKYLTLAILAATALVISCGKETGDEKQKQEEQQNVNPPVVKPYEWPTDTSAFDSGLAPGERVTGKYNKTELGIEGNGELSGPATTQKVTYGGPGVSYYGNRMTVKTVSSYDKNYPNVIPASRYISFKINRPGSIKFYGAPGTATKATYCIALLTKVKGVTSAKIVHEISPAEQPDGSDSANRTDSNIYSENWKKYWVTLDITAEDLGEIDEAATVYIFNKKNSVHYWPIIWISSENNPPVPGRKPKFLLAGDSTCTIYSATDVLKGWGQFLADSLGGGAKVTNLAVGGRSTKSFITGGNWEGLLDATVKDDIVIIQFGHNDASSATDRHTVLDGSSTEEFPEGSGVIVGNYQDNLVRMVNDVRAKNAVPVLCTSINTRTFDSSGNPTNYFSAYVPAMRSVATETNTLLLDLNLMTCNWLISLGSNKDERLAAADPYYVTNKKDGDDNTHLTALGAQTVAGMAARGIKALGLWE
ncbi:MAG: hypothetical protein J5771_00430 [Bacteroidales bacterium]|nr:hypothetical protein [Bacteroidales bacterium]